MNTFLKLRSSNKSFASQSWWSRFAHASQQPEPEEEFRVLELFRKKDKRVKKTARHVNVPPDRSEAMSPNQNWGNVWPGPRSFHPSAVPLPLRQGYVPKGQAPPGKKANAELMKIPNFLHLTPPVIKTQCEAIKKFCTPWPANLNSEESIATNYPVEVITSDYCHASPSIRNPLARIVTLRIKLSDLALSPRARDKFLRLVGDRYNVEADLVTLTADRCPLRKQNLDYVNYLLTACYHESWNVEDWEKTKSEEDMEYYDWNNNPSRKALINWYLHTQSKSPLASDEEYKSFDISSIPNGEEYKNAVSNLMNNGESNETLKNYDHAVRKVLGLPLPKEVVTVN